MFLLFEHANLDIVYPVTSWIIPSLPLQLVKSKPEYEKMKEDGPKLETEKMEADNEIK